MACVRQLVSRCPSVFLYVLVSHAEQVLAAVFMSADIFCPLLHVVWVVQVVSWCDVSVWYVSAGQAVHDPSAVVLIVEINWPAPHVVCAVHVLPSSQ